MRNRDTFSSYHPLVNFLYFGLVLLFTMCFMHPVCLLSSFTAAFCYGVNLNGRNSLRFTLRYLLPLFLLTLVLAPAFTHEGVTLLCYLPSGNPLTLESVFYGAAAAVMFAAVILWLFCYTEVMTSDKFVYLFGRIIPALSLVLSMALRFVPRFKTQLRAVSQAQRGLSGDGFPEGITVRLRNGIAAFSVLITWCMENAIETADSMKSRGYGLPGRSAFSVYRLEERDAAVLFWLIFCGIYVFSVGLAGAFEWNYFPCMTGGKTSLFSLSFFAVYLALCLTPVVINRREARRWNCLQSEI